MERLSTKIKNTVAMTLLLGCLVEVLSHDNMVTKVFDHKILGANSMNYSIASDRNKYNTVTSNNLSPINFISSNDISYNLEN